MTPDLNVDPIDPICNGVHFDEAERLPRSDLLRAIAEGNLFATEFHAAGRSYGGTVLALNEMEADYIVAHRGLGERVVGVVRIWRWEACS